MHGALQRHLINWLSHMIIQFAHPTTSLNKHTPTSGFFPGGLGANGQNGNTKSWNVKVGTVNSKPIKVRE